MNFGVFVLQEARISVTLYMYKAYPFSLMQTPKIPTKQVGFLINNTYIICDYNNQPGLFLDKNRLRPIIYKNTHTLVSDSCFVNLAIKTP